MPLIWRYFRRRAAADGGYGEYLDERKGGYDGGAAEIWVHVVSIGEFRSAHPAIDLLLSERFKVVLTTATPAGRHAIETTYPDEIRKGVVSVSYAPIDRLDYWVRFLETAKPRIGLAFEMEFWPGMVEAARVCNVSAWFVNAQVPARSMPRAKLGFTLLGAHPVSRAARVLAKSERMAERFRILGARDVEVIGETRFDIAPPEHQILAGKNLKAALGARSVFTFASVVAGEEQVYLKACQKLKMATEAPFVIWVPRAPELFDATFDLLRVNGFKVARRSVDISANLSSVGDLARADILLGDSFGEMFFYLSAADAVSVGGGFTEKGAHNVIEPLAVGKPVATGPEIWPIEYPGVEAAEAGLLSIVNDGDDLAAALLGFAGSPISGAEAFHAANSGASKRIVAAVRYYLSETLT